MAALGAAPAQAAPITITNVPADVYAVTTEAGGVYAFKPGAYEAVDTAETDYSATPPSYLSGGFPGSLSMGEGVSLFAKGNGGPMPTYYMGLSLTGDFFQTGGSITAEGNNNGSGIELLLGDFTQSGGTITASGDNGYGIFLVAGDFTQSGGFISAESFTNGYGIYAYSSFIQGANGILRLLPGDGTGHSVYVGGGAADLSGALEPGVDLAAKTIGYLEAGSGVTINPGATLRPHIINSLDLGKGAGAGPLMFMSAPGGITGAYPAPASPLTLNYLAEKNAAGDEYYLTVSRAKNVSDVVENGNNSNMARSTERHAAWLFGNAATNNRVANLVLAYTAMDMATSQGDMDAMARSLTGSEPMRLPFQALQNMDQAAKALTDALAATARKGVAAPGGGEYSGERLWSAWLTPLTRFDSYDAGSSDFEDADGAYFGVSAGAARHLNGGALGFAAHFIHGDLNNGSDFTSNTVGLNAAFRTDPLEVSASFTPWLEIGLGYAYSDIDQDRDDFFGVSHDSDFDQHAFRAGLAFGHDFYVSNNALRLTPIIGLDYTYIWQSDASESGLGLPLEWDSTSLNSLRGKVGGELEYSLDRWAVNAHAFYRYEFLDTYADTTASFVDTPVAFDLEGEDYDPSSGQAGLGVSFDASEDITLSTGYDFTFGDNYQSHGITASFQWDF